MNSGRIWPIVNTIYVLPTSISSLSRVKQTCSSLSKLSLTLLVDAGFNARAENQSAWFTDILNMEIDKLKGMKDEFLNDHSSGDYDDLINGWNDKVARVDSGTQSVIFSQNSNFSFIQFLLFQWTVFIGTK